MAGDAVSSLAKGVQRGAAQAVAKGKAPAVEGGPEEAIVAAPKYVEVSQETAAESAEASTDAPPRRPPGPARPASEIMSAASKGASGAEKTAGASGPQPGGGTSGPGRSARTEARAKVSARVEAPAANAVKAEAEAPALVRAEATLDDWGQRLGALAVAVSQQARKSVALVQEEAEDIWAEAQSLHRNSRTSAPKD